MATPGGIEYHGFVFLSERKKLCFDDLALLPAADIREWLCLKLFQAGTDEEMIEWLFFWYLQRQIYKCVKLNEIVFMYFI